MERVYHLSSVTILVESLFKPDKDFTFFFTKVIVLNEFNFFSFNTKMVQVLLVCFIQDEGH